ncbi:MAG: VCBS repeat-containing protein, partial [Desulfobacterales bacterium]|nr:VCBS repeat-containing protein [Desulfobacterales bacterium]
SATAAVQTPVLKWQYGGCYSSWCETGWYSSPAVTDLDRNGSFEIIGSAYSIAVLNGDNGSLIWRVPSGHDLNSASSSNVGRTWPGIVAKDIDKDGSSEIITAHSGGYVSVYDHRGYFKPGWPKRPITNELRGLTVDDLDGDGSDEIVVTGATYGQTNVWVYEHNGSLRSGWPQLSNGSGYSYGVFNDNAWVADLDKNGSKEIIVPSDVHYICAYSANGVQLPTNSLYQGKGWGKVGLWESAAIEERGWGDCKTSRAERYRANLAHGAATAADLDGDGT